MSNSAVSSNPHPRTPGLYFMLLTDIHKQFFKATIPRPDSKLFDQNDDKHKDGTN